MQEFLRLVAAGRLDLDSMITHTFPLERVAEAYELITDNPQKEYFSGDDPDTPQDEGRNFVFVSGIAGQSVRDQERCLPPSPPHGCNGEWASIYTSDQDANSGALFGTFNFEGNPTRAYFYFKDIDGKVPDEFFVEVGGR